MQNANDGRTETRPKLTSGERGSIFLRSFLLQSVWNPRGMQSVGFCFAMLPAGRRVARSKEELRAFLQRHLAFFNTNPALSTYALSAAASAELAGDPDGASEVKKALMGPLGMAGDALLWGAARPLASVAAVAALLLGVRWAPLLLIAVYNVPHLAFRARGAVAGARGGHRGAMEVLSGRFRALVSTLRGLACFGAGMVAALALRSGAQVAPQSVAVAGAFFVLSLVALKVRVPVTAIGLAGVAGGVAIMLTRV